MDVPSDADTDESLWARAVAGDGSAFAAVFDRHADTVHTHCARRAGSWVDAQDLTSLVFLEAWRQRTRVRFVDGSALPWLLVVATNVTRNQTRARRRYARALARVPGDPHAPDIADEAIADIEAEQVAAEVAACIRRLRTDEQDVVSLCDLGGLGYAEAAAVLGIPVGTVRSRLSRARARLRAMLTDPATEALDNAPGGSR